tara:strand:- start:119 stop:226 length:108 start_codon:yes stop_codon:yes gene_type:complete
MENQDQIQEDILLEVVEEVFIQHHLKFRQLLIMVD